MGNKRTITGRVDSVNDNGVKIDGTWMNYSKFFKGTKGLAQAGQAVSALVDEYQGKDYLNDLTVVGSALPNGGGNSPGAVSAAYTPGRSSDTNERIARQVALKAAVDFRGAFSSATDEAAIVASARIFERFLAEPYGEANVEDAA